MSVSIPDFWKLLIDSRLLTHEQCHLLGGEFAGVKGAAAQANAKSLSQFLIARNALTGYQSTVILAGRSGPFFYGDYKVYDRVDNGRLTGLFRAVHVPTSHLVMLQFFTGAVTQDPQLWATMAQQVQYHCGLVHPHLQRWHEPVDLTSFKFLVGEDLQGESLDQRLAACGVLPPHEACRVVRAAALGLSQMHQAGLVHGDIRPANLWFEPTGNVKLLRDPASTPTPIHLTPSDQANQLQVKSDYLAPELAQQGKTHDVLTDVYALGCALYQLLTGRPPFPGGDVMHKLSRHAAERIQPPETFGVPPQISQVVSYMMAKNPGVRFQQAAAVVDQLTPFIDPAYLYLQPPAPAPSLLAYETWVGQKQAALSNAAPSPAELGGWPQVDVSRKRSSPAFSVGPPQASAPIGPPQGTPTPIAVGVAAGVVGVGPPAMGPIVVGPTFGPPAGATPTVEAVATAPRVAIKAAAPTNELHKDEIADLDGGFSNRKTRNLVIGLGIVAVLAILAVVGINAMSGKPKPKDKDETVNVEDGAGTGEEAKVDVKTTPGGSVKTLPGLPKGGNVPGETVVSTDSPVIKPGPVVKAPGVGKTPNVGKTPAVETPPDVGTKPNPGTKVTPSKPANNDAPEVAVAQQVVPDDGSLLWASPTSGAPISLNYMPPGSQFFLVARPADLLASPEGARVLTALGPEFAATRTAWEAASGVKLDEVEQLVIGLYENAAEAPRPAIAVRLKASLSEEELLGRWGSPKPVSHEKGAYYAARGWAFYIPPSAGGKGFVMGSPDEIKNVVSVQGAAPALRREIEKLRSVSDSQRHLTLLFAPNYLFNDEGQRLFAGERQRMLKALFWFLGDGLQGGLVSLHFGSETYAELRFLAEAGKKRIDLANEFKARLQEIPDLIENYIVELDPPVYWKRLANRYPQMIRFLHQNTRVGVEDDQAIINAVLPAIAGHNLFAASELVMISAPGAPSVVVTTGGPPKPAVPMTIEGVLASKMSMSFAQDSLEFSMQNVAKQVKEDFSSLPFEFKVVLMGNDMKLDGITKNQSIRDFNEKDKTVGEILTAIVRKGNPITTVKDPSELDQKLIWVIGPDPDAADKQCILITTRAAAEKNSYKLPPQFEPKKP